MAKLKRIEIINGTKPYEREIRIDWDNDRHQSIIILGDAPDAVIKGFKCAADLLSSEVNENKI